MRKRLWIDWDTHAQSQTTPEARCLLKRFSRSLHPRGMTMGAPPHYQIAMLASGYTAAMPHPQTKPSSHPEGYNISPPFIFISRFGLQSLTRTLPCTANTTQSSSITKAVHIFDTNSDISQHFLYFSMHEVLPNHLSSFFYQWGVSPLRLCNIFLWFLSYWNQFVHDNIYIFSTPYVLIYRSFYYHFVVFHHYHFCCGLV